MEIVQTGWFIVGDGMHGKKEYGHTYEPKTIQSDEEDAVSYWTARGYELIPVFTASKDKE